MGIITKFLPHAILYAEAYKDWKGQQGSSEGDTVSFTDLLSELTSTYARQWDVAVQNEYDINTPEYKSLLPNQWAVDIFEKQLRR